jgi:hypothetical protein
MLRKGQALRVLRGGAFNNNATNCRAAYRNNNTPGNRNNNNGLRVVRAPERQCFAVGIAEASTGESRPVPARAATHAKQNAQADGLVGLARASVRLANHFSLFMTSGEGT